MSTLSQFAPFAGGGLKSFQTGYIGTGAAPGSGSGEDTKFQDVTISAVTVAKSIPGAYGNAGVGGTIRAGYQPASSSYSAILLPRLTSTTNLRLAVNWDPGAPFSADTNLSARWQVAEAN
jgi:hypothetical protein